MGVLANTRRGQPIPGRWVMVPKGEAPGQGGAQRRRSRVLMRRRRNFERLVVAAGGTFILGLIPGLRFLLFVHVLVDAALVAYVYQLRQWKQAEIERQRALRRLAERAEELPVEDDATAPHERFDLGAAEEQHEPYPLRRSASS